MAPFQRTQTIKGGLMLTTKTGRGIGSLDSVRHLIRCPQARGIARRATSWSVACSITLLNLYGPGVASAQESSASQGATTDSRARGSIEEVIVTAEKRAESIQDLPIAISAYSGETLVQGGVEGLQNLQRIAPSLQLERQPGLATRINIRGIGTSFGEEVAVAVSRDGVAYANSQLITGEADFFDVERVEVLRGPQGTISGRNATGGAINIHSKRPTEELEGSVKATIGNYDQLGVEGVVSGPIREDRLLGRLAVRRDRADGWVTNTLLGEELNDIDSTYVRGSLLARITDNFEALLFLEGFRDRSTPLSSAYVDVGRLRPDRPTLTESLGVPAYDPDHHTVQLSDRADMDSEKYQSVLKLDWSLGSAAHLTSTTGYIDQDQTSVWDLDNTALRELWFDNVFTNVKQLSQELTLTADLSDRLDMILGAYYLDSERYHAFTLNAGGVFSLNRAAHGVDLSSWAGYTQWRYRLTDDLRVTAGARFTRDSKDYAQADTINGASQPVLKMDGTWDAWTPRIALDYSALQDVTLYLSASRGFASGGITESGRTFEPEFVWNYEAGAKANFFDGRLATALTGFFMDYTDMQQSLQTFDAVQNRFVESIFNLNSATILGVELELDAQVTDRLRFTLAGTWLDATYDEGRQPDPLFPELGAPLPEAPDGPNFRDLSGNRLQRAPEWQFNASAEYRAPLGIAFLGADLEGVLRVAYAWQDETFFDLFNNEPAAAQGSYGLVNLFGAIETADGHWQLSAFAQNLTDEFYSSIVFSDTVAGVWKSNARVGGPRRYGLSVAYNF